MKKTKKITMDNGNFGGMRYLLDEVKNEILKSMRMMPMYEGQRNGIEAGMNKLERMYISTLEKKIDMISIDTGLTLMKNVRKEILESMRMMPMYEGQRNGIEAGMNKLEIEYIKRVEWNYEDEDDHHGLDLFPSFEQKLSFFLKELNGEV